MLEEFNKTFNLPEDTPFKKAELENALIETFGFAISVWFKILFESIMLLLQFELKLSFSILFNADENKDE